MASLKSFLPSSIEGFIRRVRMPPIATVRCATTSTVKAMPAARWIQRAAKIPPMWSMTQRLASSVGHF